MPHESEDRIALRRVKLPPHGESDEKDRQMDLRIIQSHKSNDPAVLLSSITVEDKGLKTLSIGDAEALIKDHPVLERVIQCGCNAKSFRCVRELGASSIVIGFLSGS
jgi:hypothetical protein